MSPKNRRPQRNLRREESAVLTISQVGAQGDGVAIHNGRRVYVPHTVAGDQARIHITPGSADGDRGRVEELLIAGPDRIAPACRHFDRCGGCSVQHLAPAVYADWKLGLLTEALGRVGLADVPMAPMILAQPGERRRARFALLRRGRYVFAGYNQRMSDKLVDLEECPVLPPALPALLAPLRAVMLNVLKEGEVCDAAATLLDGGVDLLLIGPAKLTLDARMDLAAFAESADLARLSWQADDKSAPEPVAARRPVGLDFGGVRAVPVAGGFLQASIAGEAALRAVVTAATAGAARVVDLFCGMGTFALPLAARGLPAGKVLALDGDAGALAALESAARAARLSALEIRKRDLFRDPFTAGEMADFDAAVFDPPRAGGAAQAAELAKSSVKTIAAISCNPASFARDADILTRGGYRLTRIQPVDQFLWSAHLELAAVFER